MADNLEIGALESRLNEIALSGDLAARISECEGSSTAGLATAVNHVLDLHSLEITALRQRLRDEVSAREDQQTASAMLRQAKELLKQRSNELTAALAKAAALSEAKSLFLANVSHELRTPMNGIIGMSEVLLRGSLDDRQRRIARTIVDSGRALITIINDILDFSKIESGKIELRPMPFQPKRCVEDVVALLHTQASSKKVALTAHFDENLPNLVIGDAGRIRQVFMNLIGNAVKFTDFGRVDVRVKAERFSGKARLLVEIEDSGPGIPADKLDSIFEKFTQVDNTSTRRHEGTGLGLTICKQLVEKMGGKISVESTLGVGSTFSLTLELPSPDGDVREAPIASALAGRSVVVVNVAVNGSEKVVHALREAGGTVTLANGWGALDATVPGAEALVIACNAVDDEVIGKCRALRAPGSIYSGPIVVLTITGFIGDASALERADVNGYMTATLSPGVQRAIVATVLQDRQFGTERLVTQHTIAEAELAQSMSPPVTASEQPMAGQEHPTDTKSVLNERAENTPPAIQNQAAQRHVLVVDDSTVNQAVAIEFLIDMACEVTTANNGREAVDLAIKGGFDLILMDCQMPIMDGFEATRQIRAREHEAGSKRIPIIALTANAFSKDRQNCLDAGMDDFLTKPLLPEQLENAIERYA